jgi:hypothetical protein
MRIRPQPPARGPGVVLEPVELAITRVLAVYPRHAPPHHLGVDVEVPAVDAAHQPAIAVAVYLDHLHCPAKHQGRQRLLRLPPEGLAPFGASIPASLTLSPPLL